MTEPNVEALAALARAGRVVLRRLWEGRDERERLAEPERRMLAIMDEHREYRPFWDGAEPDDATDNPFAHVTLHQLVEKQIATDDPAGTRAAFEALLAAGHSHHDALHRLMESWALEIARRIRERTPFDAERYRAELERVSGTKLTS